MNVKVSYLLIHTRTFDEIRIHILINLKANNIPKETRARIYATARSGPFVSYATYIRVAVCLLFLSFFCRLVREAEPISQYSRICVGVGQYSSAIRGEGMPA
jgi:hypothetical protein